MNELSLFTGAGGGLLGTKLLGWRHIGYVEINEYCQRVIRQRIDDGILDEAPIFSDIRAFISEGYADAYSGLVDVVTGGFPCQDISQAGSSVFEAKGINGDRSGLWAEMAEIVGRVRPRWVIVENSPMLTSRGLGRVLGDLAEMGFDARWGCISGNQVGAFHRRERIWIVANANGDRLERRHQDSGEAERNRQGVYAAPLAVHPSQFEVPTPGIFGATNGLPDRVERTRAIGNAQIPSVVRAAWKLLNS